MCMPGGGAKASNQAANDAKKREAQRRANLDQGTAAIDASLAPFNDADVATRSDAYSRNALPKLGQQFNEAQKQLIYALSRGGLLSSSVGADKQRALNAERAAYERDIASQAAGYANEGRANLEKTRASLIGQLGATEDPAQAASAAAREAGLLSAPPTFDALGNFVFNTSQGLQDLSNRTTGGRGFISGGPATYLGGGSKGAASYVRG